MNFTKDEIIALKEVAQERIDAVDYRKHIDKQNKKIDEEIRKSGKKSVCAFLFIKTGRCNSKYWKGKKCNKKKCPWKNGGSFAMAMHDQGNWLR